MRRTPSPRLSRSRRLQAAVIGAVASPLIRALGATLSWRVDGIRHFDAIVRSGRQPILALWHGRILPATLFWRDRGIVALTSQNFDGEWIAQLMSRFGYAASRGSSSRGGARALVELRRTLRDGRPAAFTLDGPRGPAEVVQPGALWLARATRNPILPFHIEADRYWTTRSWDKGQVPKPFSTVAVAIGQPFEVCEGERSLEAYAVDLHNRLQALRARSIQLLL